MLSVSLLQDLRQNELWRKDLHRTMSKRDKSKCQSSAGWSHLIVINADSEKQNDLEIPAARNKLINLGSYVVSDNLQRVAYIF